MCDGCYWGHLLTHFFQGSKGRKRPSERVTTIREHTNVDNQFQLTPAVIEERRIELQETPLDELAALFRIQEGNPDTAVERVSRADKENLIDSIIDHMVDNHNSVTEERHQFVLWLYSIRSHHGNHYGFL